MEKFVKKLYTRPETDDFYITVRSTMLNGSAMSPLTDTTMTIGTSSKSGFITADSKERNSITIDHNDDYYDDDDALW